MLSGEVIRDVGRVLPWLASVPGQPSHSFFTRDSLARTPAKRSREIVEVFAEGLRHRYDTVYAALDRAADKLAAEIRAMDPEKITDPEGEAVESLEAAESYFRAQREELRDVRSALIGTGGSTTYGKSVFTELDRLCALFGSVIECMQEVRWALLIADDVRAPTTGREFTRGAELVEALDDP